MVRLPGGTRQGLRQAHASPVLHAINYLLGDLDGSYLTRLREFGGLQSYPSRTKDPDKVDYSTGSVGIGATATIWGALAHRYTAGHFEVPVGGRQIALVGDAELDEGACWEALIDPMTYQLGEVLWIVDLNRQSLDRVVPDIAATRLRAMFDAAGWHCLTVKYGRLLERFSNVTAAGIFAVAWMRCPTRSTSACCEARQTNCANDCPAPVVARARFRSWSLTWTTANCCGPFAIWGVTT